ncbi:serine/arginine repetitive matrix protein 1-like isoform X2 [Sitodiplosis mosellana]|nr:serine/arginine repetitive matrix protein 1-like isoform X2 [Sitodiplosis mosellana]
MCDSCIIQLNVAYNLKKNAIQSDMKLRQYMIEFGINVTSYTTCSINTVSVIHPPAMIMPATTTSESVTITTAKSTTVAPQQGPPPPAAAAVQPQPHQLPQQHRTFPVMPVIIKEEPVDYEAMSDITVETNTEAFEDQMRHQRNQGNRTNGNQSAASTSSSSNKSVTPLPVHNGVHSMVSVNTKSLMLSPQASSDREFLSAYMLTTPSANVEQAKKTTTQPKPPATKQKSPETLSKAAPKSKRPNESPPQNANKAPVKRNRRCELDNLNDDSTIRMIKATKLENNSPRRQTRQQLRETHDNENKRPPSRSRSGTKTDYKSFFTSRSATPVTNGTPTKLRRRMSIDGAVKRKGRSPINIRTPSKNKHMAAIVRKRRSSMAHNRTSI